MLFGYFLHNAKSDNPFSLQRTSRFCKPRISSPQRRLRIDKIKSFAAPRTFAPPAAASWGGYAAFLCCLRQLCPTFCKVQKVGQKTLKLSFGKFVPAGTARFACFFAACGGSLSVAVATFLPPAAALFKGSHFPAKCEKEQRRRDRYRQKVGNRLCQKYRKGLVRKEIRQNVD